MGKTRINTAAADDLRLELQDAALSLRCAYDRFNHVTDPELVEASIYEINSLQARYNYLLRRAKVEVLVASASGSREILSSHKVHITADALAEEVDYSDVDLVVLPGGIPGTPNLAANKTVTDTCIAFAKAGKKVAAICAAPSVLAALGLLEGKNATAHAAFQDKLTGAHVLDTEVVVDGNITTSYGLGGAIPFALELVRQLAGEAEADRIRGAIAYRH